MTLRATAHLAAWLGPWAGAAAPRGVTRARFELGGPRGAFPAYRYEPAPGGPRPAGAYLITQGLHFMGPDDPRMDRFCRVLAASGLIVVAPFLPDYVALRIDPRVADDLAVAFDHTAELCAARGVPAPAVFSVSFGSQPASQLAAREGYRDRVRALVLFGGFADFDATVRFAVTGQARALDGTPLPTVPHDPLNAPVVYMNLLPHLALAPGIERGRVMAAWRAMVDRTWNNPALKRPGARDPIARAIAETLPARAERELFLTGCGLHAGGAELLERGLRAARDAFAFADPRPHLARVAAPVLIVHGRDDDVIPWSEAHKLAAALPAGHPHRVAITGMYGHTGAAVPGARALFTELRTLLALVRSVAQAPRGLRAWATAAAPAGSPPVKPA